MHTLILFAHAEPDSLTAAVAQQVADGLVAAGGTAEIADLAAEGFDPRHTAQDLAVVRGQGTAPADILAEQHRVERAQSLVVIHPVYWWSMPALLKGWFDRVLTFGWAFGTAEATALSDRRVHLVRLGGSAPETYAAHGYSDAIRTGVEHGIFEFAGSPVVSSHLVHTAPEGVEQRVAEAVEAVVTSVTAARTEVSA